MARGACGRDLGVVTRGEMQTVTRVIVGVVGVMGLAWSAVAQPPPSANPPPLAYADVETYPFQLGVRGLIGVPLGDFADNVNTSGGVGADFGYRVPDSPVHVGVTFGVVFQGGATREVPLSLTIPDVFVDVRTSANVVALHGRVRYQPTTGRARPYVDALIGFNYLFTQTTVDLDNDFDPTPDPRTTNLSDATLSGGVGGGVLIGLVQWEEARLSLDLGAQYLVGGNADYFVGGPEGFDRGVEGLELRRSRTDLFMIVAGVAVEF